MVFLLKKKSSRTDSLKTFITRELLAVKVWAITPGIALNHFQCSIDLFTIYPRIRMTWFWPEVSSYSYAKRSVINSQV